MKSHFYKVSDGESSFRLKDYDMTVSALRKKPQWIQELAKSADFMPNVWVSSFKFSMKRIDP